MKKKSENNNPAHTSGRYAIIVALIGLSSGIIVFFLNFTFNTNKLDRQIIELSQEISDLTQRYQEKADEADMLKLSAENANRENQAAKDELQAFQSIQAAKPVIEAYYNKNRLQYGTTADIKQESNIDIFGIHDEGIAYFLYTVNDNDLKLIKTTVPTMVIKMGAGSDINKGNLLKILAIATDGSVGDWHEFRFVIVE